MSLQSNLDLLRKLLEQCDRIHELERADLGRRIKEAERARPLARSPQIAGRAHTEALLKVMQGTKEPLPAREIARRLESDAHTVRRWLAAATKRGRELAR